jgi:hypothetical protein
MYSDGTYRRRSVRRGKVYCSQKVLLDLLTKQE